MLNSKHNLGENMSKKTIYKRADCAMTEYEKEQQRLKALKEKQERESSPSYIRAEKGRSLIKKMTYANNKIASIKLEAFNEISRELLGFVEHDLINNSEMKPFNQVQEIINYYKRSFVDLEELSNGTMQNAVYNPPYDKFFLELMKKNAYFVYFARPKTFEISGIPFEKIPYKERIEVLKPHLESLGLFENEKFVKRYGKHFDIATKKNTI